MHRALSLGMAAFWLLQAVTGVVAVFHWEIDDANLPGRHRPTDFAAIERALEDFTVRGSGRRISTIWTSAGAPDRWDVQVDGPPGSRSESVRIDGAGHLLRRRSDGERIAAGGWLDTLVSLHQNLLNGDAGQVVVGLSGLLLLSNVLLGFTLGRPRLAALGRALWPSRKGPPAARAFNRHRAIGLWGAPFAVLTIATGVLLAFADQVERAVPPMPEPPTISAKDARSVGLARAVTIALARRPGSVVSGVHFPSREDATWSVRLRQRGEAIRAYGKTRVTVSALDGRVVQDWDELKAPWPRWAFDHLFAFHTGEVAGLPGRVAVLAVGLWLVTVIVLGLSLWSVRRSGAKGER